MTLELRSIPDTFAAAAAIAQSYAPELTNLDENSPLGAYFQALAFISSHHQLLDVQVAAISRLATSEGEDIDSYIADFGQSRLPGVAAGGLVTFSRITPTLAAVIPPGVTLKTSDGTVNFIVTQDETNAAWSDDQQGYVVGANVLSVSVPAQATILGAAGNVKAGTITQLTTALPGIDTVSNLSAFVGGMDAESDAAVRKRFAAWLSTHGETTVPGIEAAIESVQQGLSYTVNECMDMAHASKLGWTAIWVDDGTGSPSSDLISRIQKVVDGAKSSGTVAGVAAASTVSANVSLTVTAATGYDKSALVVTIRTAIQNYINTLGVGVDLSYLRLAQVAQDAAEGIAQIDNLTLNGGTSNVSANVWQSIHAGTVTVA